MSHSSRSTFLLITTLFVADIFAATPSEHNNTIANFNVSKNPHCYDDEHDKYHPTTIDCLHARRGIPIGWVTGMFHRDGPDDKFQLPIITSDRTCTIVIDLEGNLPESTTWSRINLATRTLIRTCSKITDTEAKTGGITHVGQIRISLLKIPPGDPGFDNITESVSTS